MASYKLTYFNGRGRAEVTRLIFVVTGQNFEDVRIEQDDWPSHKSEMPLGQVPVLEVDGVKLPQSLSIARFVAKQFHLAGKDNLEQAKVDVVIDTIADANAEFAPIRWGEDETKKEEAIKKFFAEDLQKHLKNLEVLAKEYSNGGPFFVGNKLTWADLLVYDILEGLLQIDNNILNKYSWLQRNREEVAKQPKIAAYLKNRPNTEF